MKHCLALALGLLFPVVICAQHANMQMKSSEKPATMMAGMGAHHHPVSTTNAQSAEERPRGHAGQTTIRGGVEKCRHETHPGSFVIKNTCTHLRFQRRLLIAPI
jgi:hypothetical protein